MRKISEREYQIAKKHNLLFDGKNVYKELHPMIKRNASNGRTFIRTCHGHIWVTEGQQGIYDMILAFIEKESGINDKQ